MTGSLITRVYGAFGGVDFREENISLNHSPDALNVWKDYKEKDGIRTRPAMKLHTAFSDAVYGIFFFKDTMIVHCGKSLYAVRNDEVREIFTGLNEAESSAFVYNDTWYFKDGKHYLQYDGTTIKAVEGYIPTTTIARKPLGGGVLYNDVNLLSNKRNNTFLADGESKVFALDAKNIDTAFMPIVKINGILSEEFSVDYTEGVITFTEAPPAPLTDGQDNVSITFQKTVDGHYERISKCTLLQVFDNRVFFSGNPDYPNVVFHCSLDDPSYCSDLDYYDEGMDNAAIRGLVAANNALWVFREPSDANTTVFYHTPTLDSDYGKIYPSQHSSVTTGCIGRAINFNDDIVFFSDRGMEGISGDVTTEQVVAHRSTLVDRRMTAESGYKNMILVEHEGYLIVFIENKAYLADSRTAFSNIDHMEYEWFYWEMEKEITCARVQDGILYLGTESGVFTLTDADGGIDSYWTTAKDRFEAPNKLKTTNKRGCVAEATGNVAVYAKIEDTDFEKIGEYTNVSDYFVSRIKRKKFKDIQLRFRSSTRFSLETVTLECFIGGYVKR